MKQKKEWGKNFIGVYFYDEPEGTMLDKPNIQIGYGDYAEEFDEAAVSRTENEISVIGFNNKTFVETRTYHFSGEIRISRDNASITYHPDGTITASTKETTSYTPENITLFPYSLLSYEEVLRQHPNKPMMRLLKDLKA